MTEPLASRAPWMVSAGNHDIEYNSSRHPREDPTAAAFQAFEARFRMPAVRPAEGLVGGVVHLPSVECTPSVFLSRYNYGNSFYSFDVGLVHVVNLNSYSVSEPHSAQYRFLLSDLKTVNRRVTPWVVVMVSEMLVYNLQST